MTEAPEFTKIQLQNAVAPGEKEPQGSEKRQEPMLVLGTPTRRPALGGHRFLRAAIPLSQCLVLQPRLPLEGAPHCSRSFPKWKPQPDGPQLQETATALGTKSKPSGGCETRGRIHPFPLRPHLLPLPLTQHSSLPGFLPYLKNNPTGPSLAVWWLRFSPSTTGGMGSIACPGTKILHAI